MEVAGRTRFTSSEYFFYLAFVTSLSLDFNISSSLVDMHVIARTGGSIGRGVEPYEDKGLKDVVWLGPSETVYVEAAYQPWDGLYM